MLTTRGRLVLGGYGLCLLVSLLACERSQPTTKPPDQKSATTASAPSSSPAGSATSRPLGPPTGTFIDREDPLDLRLLCYNVLWNSIFPDVDRVGAEKFARLVAALNPDVLALQEIGVHPRDRDRPKGRAKSAEDVRQLLDTVAALPDGNRWHAVGGGDCVIASKYPLKLAADQPDPPGERKLAMALVDLPDAYFGPDLYVINTHFKCCDGQTNDPLRQKQSDAIAAWIRDLTTPGGQLDLPAGTAIVIAGDLNIVGGFQPVKTLLEGDIVDNDRYGEDWPPDWDRTPLADAHPLHNLTGPEDWTWRDDEQPYPPGRLDFVLYADSVLEAVKKFALNTTAMTDQDLKAAGLNRFDSAKDEVGRSYDHLPLVVDFQLVPGADSVPLE